MRAVCSLGEKKHTDEEGKEREKGGKRRREVGERDGERIDGSTLR